MNNKKLLHRPKLNITLFTDKPLVVLVSVVTLLLQLISFSTTWNGSKIYLEGAFPYASLLFAVAIQATAYFFSNSLRNRMHFLKIVALFVALCCSTYYSYIGIYNSVNAPANYLQEKYVSIRQELSQSFQSELENHLSSARAAVNDAASLITAEYTSLTGKQQNIDACRLALEGIENTYTSSMRPPNRYSYENYEDYAAAYQAYINTASQGINAETEAARSNTLSSYGFASVDELNSAEQENAAATIALESALLIDYASDSGDADAGSALLHAVSQLSQQLTTAINAASMGQSFTDNDIVALNTLTHAAGICGYEKEPLSLILYTVNQCAEASATTFMADYPSLVASLPEGILTSANTMELKSRMDSEILAAQLTINSLLPPEEQLSLSDPSLQITDLYLIPIEALRSQDTQTTALFSLGVAALIDMLSVLFAISLRERKTLWKRHTLMFSRLEDYAPLIYAALPLQSDSSANYVQALQNFLVHFRPSPRTECDGYMMMAPMDELASYSTLAALLCQVNLAKLVPGTSGDILLLRARFVFWANAMIYDENSLRNEAVYE